MSCTNHLFGPSPCLDDDEPPNAGVVRRPYGQFVKCVAEEVRIDATTLKHDPNQGPREEESPRFASIRVPS